MVVTSGGAYRASFWTALVLDRLMADPQLEDLKGSIRLLTGASGGMVASAYFAAMSLEDDASSSVLDRLQRDIVESNRRTADDGVDTTPCSVQDAIPFRSRYPIPNDSLSAVVQQLIQRDLFRVLVPSEGLCWDRGIVLERQWKTLQSTTFYDLLEGEQDARVPSIVFSPMIVESGQPLLISNLDLDGVVAGQAPHRTTGVEFFRLFPGAHDDFRIATAVRMNATFPYVSPGVELPTDPPVRIVDAGYYDNFGVATASAWLAEESVRSWVRRFVGRVIVVQIRAFKATPVFDSGPSSGVAASRPSAPTCLESSDCHPWERCQDRRCRSQATGWEWLLTPVDAVSAARASTMALRNDQDLKILEPLLHPVPVDTVVFEAKSEAEMSWYVSSRGVERLRADLTSPENEAQLERLRILWSAAPESQATEVAPAEVGAPSGEPPSGGAVSPPP